jgi:hypothetical protein
VGAIVLERAPRSHWYMVVCDGIEIGSAVGADAATWIAQKEAGRRPLHWHRKPAVWFALAGETLYEVKELREAGPSPSQDLLEPHGRRHC